MVDTHLMGRLVEAVEAGDAVVHAHQHGHDMEGPIERLDKATTSVQEYWPEVFPGKQYPKY